MGHGGGTWDLVGPTNIGGRVTDLVVDPTTPNTLYVAAAGGGIWKSTDAGMTYAPAWPDDYDADDRRAGAGSDGTLWVGTGEANPSGGGLTYFGDGVYRSTDGGAHWQHAGLADSGAFGRIVVDPTEPEPRLRRGGRHCPARPASAASTGSTDGGATGSRSFRRRTTRPAARPRDRPDEPQPRSSRRSGTTSATAARARTAASAPACSAPTTAATTGRGWRTSSAPHPADAAGTGLKSDASLGRIGVAIAPSDPTASTSSAARRTAPTRASTSRTTAATRSSRRPRRRRQRLRVVVRPHLGRPDEQEPSLQRRRQPARVQGRRRDVGDSAERARRPARDGVGPERRRTASTSATTAASTARTHNGATRLVDPRDVRAVEPVLPPRRRAPMTRAGSRPACRTTAATGPGRTTAEPSDLSQWNSYGGGDGHYVLIDHTDHNIYYECSQVGVLHAAPGRERHVHGPLGSGTRHSSAHHDRRSDRARPDNPSVVYFGGNVLDRSTDRGTTSRRSARPVTS